MSTLRHKASTNSLTGSAFFGSTDALGAAGDGKGIWASILQSVASSKSVQSKNVLVLGDARVGKTTLINSIRQAGLPEEASGASEVAEDLELALSYSYMEVNDEENEDIVARIGLYHLASETAFGNLFRFALNVDTLADSLVIIVLDWSRPWTFLKTLDEWLGVLEQQITKLTADKGWLLDELRERVEAYFRNYSESLEGIPKSGADGKPATAGAAQHGVVLPLGPGTLTKNLGVPIVVVAAKSDATVMLEREHDYREEQFDFIQQSLRTVCLQYGAALFYTTTHRSTTLDSLRAYVLHRLLGPSTLTTTISNVLTSTSSTAFPFDIRPQVVERDTILVPSGWDSWGKIKVLRDGFDCEAMAGEEDDGVASDSPRPGFLARSRVLYESVVINPLIDESLPAEPSITAENEQSFLTRHLELLQSSSANTASPSTAGAGGSYLESSSGSKARLGSPAGSVVSSTSSLDDVTAKLAKLAKVREQTASRDKLKSPTGDIPLSASLISSTAVSRAAGAIGAGNGPPASQNEVLANFFQSLLAKKSTVVSGGTVASSGSARSSITVAPSSMPTASGLASSDRKPVSDRDAEPKGK